MADMRTPASSPSFRTTTILVGELPSDIEADVLRSHFSVVLDTEVNSVSLLHDKRTGVFQNAAYLNVGSYEKAQRAIREVNGSVFQGKRIMVSLAINQYTPPLSKTLVLKNLPEQFTALDVYDFLKKYGEIVAIKVAYDEANRLGLGYAFASFVTEEDAKNAIQDINAGNSSSRHSMMAESCKSSAHRHQYVSPGKSRIRRNTSQFALDSAASQSDSGNDTVLSTADGQDVPESGVDHGVTPTSPLAVTDDDGDLAEAAHDLRQQLGIDSITSLSRRKEIIWEHLFPMYAEEYEGKVLKRLLNVLLRSLDVDTLLEVAVDEDLFRMYAGDAEKVMNKENAVIPTLSRRALRLRRVLDLDTMTDEEERLATLKGYLRQVYMANAAYADCFDEVLTVLFRSFSLRELLDIAVDAKQFHMYATDAMEIYPSTQERLHPLPCVAVVLWTKLNLATYTSTHIRKQVIGDYLYRRYLDQYTTRRMLLCRILGILIGNLSVNTLLRLAVSPTIFPSYADEVIALLHAERVEGEGYELSDAARALMEQLDIETKASYEEKKQAVSDHLNELYQGDLALRSDLQTILNMISHSLHLNELLELSNDRHLFQIYAMDAEEALNKGRTLLYPLSSKALELRKLSNWDLIARDNEQVSQFRKFLHKQHQATPVFLELMDNLLFASDDDRDVNEIFEILALNKKEAIDRLQMYAHLESTRVGDVFGSSPMGHFTITPSNVSR